MFYKIELLSAPVIEFAHGYKSEKYDITMRSAPRIIEITYIERGDIIRLPDQNGGGGFIYGEEGIAVISHAKSSRFICRAPVQSHFSVGFSFDNRIELLDAEALYTGAADLLKSNQAAPADNKPHGRTYAVLPQYIAPYNGITDIQKAIKHIIDENDVFSDTARRLESTANIYALLAMLTRLSYRIAAENYKGQQRAENIYLRRASAYINSHIAEKIRVEDVAGAAGISYGYLNKLFREFFGISITDYINQLKLRNVKELITSKNITVSEAGRIAGFSDSKYLSRIFKRYNGITAAEYKRLHNNADSGIVGNMVNLNIK